VDVSGSMFAPCPVCGRTIAIKHADAHVSACVRLGERARERGGKVPTSAEARTVKEDFRGRRSHTGKTTTGFVAGDELRGGWIERGESRRRKGRTDEEQSAEETNDAFAEMRRAAKRMAMVKLPGHFLIENFIDEDEERRIIEFLDEDVERPWRDSSFNGAHEGKKYGVEPNLLKRIVEPAKVPIPRVLRELVIKKFADAHPTLKNFSPNECNAINYRKDLGSVLTPHCDDRQLSSDLLVNLSLVCDCTMTYTNEKFPEKRVDVYLPRRSLQIQSGQTRYDYMHSIANENLHGNRRVSVTFRESGVLKKP
jgi:alkylated DNA repair dioxygenase AlkB